MARTRPEIKLADERLRPVPRIGPPAIGGLQAGRGPEAHSPRCFTKQETQAPRGRGIFTDGTIPQAEAKPAKYARSGQDSQASAGETFGHCDRRKTPRS